MYEARIEKDSITQYGERLTTFVVTFPRIVLAEFNTHKMISKSSASSRAIPIEKQIARLMGDLFEPVHWGKNQKGMQAEEELAGEDLELARRAWNEARRDAVYRAQTLAECGVHKQIANRLLEPFMWHTVIATGTEWSNFFHLRDNKMAQPEIQKIAAMMNALYRESRPKLLGDDEWHLPFEQEARPMAHSLEERVKMSVGRAARVSFLNHEGVSDPVADRSLAESLLKNGHMAPWEHVARPMTDFERGHLFGRSRKFSLTGQIGHIPTGNLEWKFGDEQHFLGNFNGWVQARKLIHGEHDILAFER